MPNNSALANATPDPAAGGSRWLLIDAAAAYMGGVSRQTVYAAVRAGLRVVRIVDESRSHDSRGRRNHGKLWFNTAWIDEFLEAHASEAPPRKREITTAKSLRTQTDSGGDPVEIATRLQRTTETVSEMPRGRR